MLLLLNCRSLIRRAPLFFWLIVLVFGFTTIGLLFTANFWRARELESQAKDAAYFSYAVAPETGDLDAALAAFSAQEAETLQRLYVMLTNGSDRIVANYCGESKKTFKVFYGRPAEEGKAEIVLPNPMEASAGGLSMGDTYLLGNTPLTVVGIGINDYYETVYSAAAGQGRIYGVVAVTKTQLTGRAQEDFAAHMAQAFGGEVSLPEPMPKGEILTLDMLLIFGLMVLGMFNLCFLFSAVLEKRRRQQSVFFLLGCGRGRLFSLYIGEMLLLVTLCFSLAALLTHFALLPLLHRLAPAFYACLTLGDYLGFYFASLLLSFALSSVQLVRHFRNTPFEMLRKGGGAR